MACKVQSLDDLGNQATTQRTMKNSIDLIAKILATRQCLLCAVSSQQTQSAEACGRTDDSSSAPSSPSQLTNSLSSHANKP